MIFRLAVLITLATLSHQAMGQGIIGAFNDPDNRDSNVTRPSVRIVARRGATITGPIYIRNYVGPQDNRRRWKIRGDYQVGLLSRFRRFR